MALLRQQGATVRAIAEHLHVESGIKLTHAGVAKVPAANDLRERATFGFAKGVIRNQSNSDSKIAHLTPSHQCKASSGTTREEAMRVHPLAQLLSRMTPEEFAALRDSIAAHGLREPITVHRDGRIVDGTHREEICRELGVPIRTRTFEGPESDLLSFVLDQNLHRRHLSESQRAMIAAELETTTHGGARRGGQDASVHVDRAAVSRAFNVSPHSVADAKQVRKRGVPALVAAVKQGEFAVSHAARIAQLPQKKQPGRIDRDRRKAAGTARPDDDYFRTPAKVTHALLAVERLPKRVWDSCCGDGPISRELEAAGHTVIASDLIDRGYGEGGRDFLKETVKRADCLVINPPYDDDLPEKFAVHALKLGVRKIALLCRIQWAEGVQRAEALWRQGKLARILVFAPRQTLWRGNDEFAEDDGGMTCYAWFIIERDHSGPPTLNWLIEGPDGWHLLL